MKKAPFYFLRNSNNEPDGLWSLAVYSFMFIIFVTISQLVISTINWYYYISVIQGVDKAIARTIKPPAISMRDIASWVSAFGGLCLAPVVAGYVARRNKIGSNETVIEQEVVFTNPDISKLDRSPVKDDDGH